jgi:hypothetical protein
VTLTNRYIELGCVSGVHFTLSVTQFAFGVTVLIGDVPGQWVLIIGPFVISSWMGA